MTIPFNPRMYGDLTEDMLKGMTVDELIARIKYLQEEDNFIIMSDSYKMTHHMLYPKLKEVYSYLEPRGGEYPYSVMFGLQYYIKRYIAGVRITAEKIEEARRKNIEHFGFDCFNADMWYHILNVHGGRLPLEIKAVPEGTTVKVKNILMSIRNTDEECAALTNHTETLLLKVWATNTVGAYARAVKELMLRYWRETSDVPAWVLDFLHHDFGYRGCSSEETARLMSAAGMIFFKGTDTFGGITMLERYYGEPMAGFSVIASEHSVVCSYGARETELEAYRTMIRNVKEKCKSVKPASGVIILSLVSDTNNIYNVCYRILPELADEFVGWTNDHGIPLKIVVRPDSGDPIKVLFGDSFMPDYELCVRVAQDMSIDTAEAKRLVELGVYGILFEQFGYNVNSKGYKTLPPHIGVLQGDGINIKSIETIYETMQGLRIAMDSIVLGSGGKYLQAHDRDEQEYAIKATHIIDGNGNGVDIQKNPITSAMKKSKKGYLKLVQDDPDGDWSGYKTVKVENGDWSGDVLKTVFLDGELTKEYDFVQVRANGAIKMEEEVTA